MHDACSPSSTHTPLTRRRKKGDSVFFFPLILQGELNSMLKMTTRGQRRRSISSKLVSETKMSKLNKTKRQTRKVFSLHIHVGCLFLFVASHMLWFPVTTHLSHLLVGADPGLIESFLEHLEMKGILIKLCQRFLLKKSLSQSI